MTGVGPAELGIPIPESSFPGRPLGELGKLVREMKVGECRTFESPDLLDAAREAARRAGIKVETRKDNGWRMWRVE